MMIRTPTNPSRRLRRALVAVPVAGFVLTVGALPAAASPTCSDVDFHVRP